MEFDGNSFSDLRIIIPSILIIWERGVGYMQDVSLVRVKAILS